MSLSFASEIKILIADFKRTTILIEIFFSFSAIMFFIILINFILIPISRFESVNVLKHSAIGGIQTRKNLKI